VCIGCDKHLTIEHILLTCSDFIEIRESHFTASPEKIFNFLKDFFVEKLKYEIDFSYVYVFAF